MRVMLLVFDDDVLRLECWLHEMSIEFTVQVIMLGLGLDAHMCSSVTNQHDFLGPINAVVTFLNMD